MSACLITRDFQLRWAQDEDKTQETECCSGCAFLCVVLHAPKGAESLCKNLLHLGYGAHGFRTWLLHHVAKRRRAADGHVLIQLHLNAEQAKTHGNIVKYGSSVVSPPSRRSLHRRALVASVLQANSEGAVPNTHTSIRNQNTPLLLNCTCTPGRAESLLSTVGVVCSQPNIVSCLALHGQGTCREQTTSNFRPCRQQTLDEPCSDRTPRSKRMCPSHTMMPHVSCSLACACLCLKVLRG